VSASLRIEGITLENIVVFARTVNAPGWSGGEVPISERRAAAWAANPEAERGDAVLLVAYQGDQCVGYTGFVPGSATVDGERERVFWFSTFYVPPAWRASGVGGVLMMRSIAMKQTLCAAGTSEEAQKIWQATRFLEPDLLPYYRMDLTTANHWGKPFRAARRVAASVGAGGAVFDKADATIRRRCGGRVFADILNEIGGADAVFEALDPVDDTACAALGSLPVACGFNRGPGVIRWMLDHPWVETLRAEGQDSYYYDDYRPTHQFRVFRISVPDGGEGHAVVRLSERRGVRDVHLLDHAVPGDWSPDVLARLVVSEAKAFDADIVYLPHTCAPAVGRSVTAHRWFACEKKPYFVRPTGSSRIGVALDRFVFEYTDGIGAFA